MGVNTYTRVYSVFRTEEPSRGTVNRDIPGNPPRKVGFRHLLENSPACRKEAMTHLLRSELPRRRVTVVGGIFLLLATLPAMADIYAYTAPDGVLHYSNVPVEAAYELVLESPPEPTAGGGEESLKVPLALIHRRAAAYEHIIREAAAVNEIEPELLRAVISVESAFNPRAVSRAGARGLMQLMPQTAKRFGVRDSFDPRQNIHGGARYLRVLVERFSNNLELVVAAYNAGENAVERYGRSIPPYRETRQYVPRVLGLYRALSAPLATT